MNIYTINLPLKHIIKLNATFFVILALSCLFFTNSVFAYHGAFFSPKEASSTSTVTNSQVVNSGPSSRQAQVVSVNNRKNDELISNLRRQIAILTDRISQIIEQRENERQNQENTRLDQRGFVPTISFGEGNTFDTVTSEGTRMELVVLTSEARYSVDSPHWIEYQKQRSMKLGERSYRHELRVSIEENRTSSNRAGDIVISTSNRSGSASDRFRVTQIGGVEEEDEENRRPDIGSLYGNRGSSLGGVGRGNTRPDNSYPYIFVEPRDLEAVYGSDSPIVTINIQSSVSIDNIDIELPSWIYNPSIEGSSLRNGTYYYDISYNLQENTSPNDRRGEIFLNLNNNNGALAEARGTKRTGGRVGIIQLESGKDKELRRIRMLTDDDLVQEFGHLFVPRCHPGELCID